MRFIIRRARLAKRRGLCMPSAQATTTRCLCISKKNCIVGAGALVPQGREFPPGSLIVGAPAHISRAVSEEEMHRVREGVEHYLDAKNELMQEEEV